MDDAAAAELAAAYFEQGDLADHDLAEDWSEDRAGYVLSLLNGTREDARHTVIEAAHRWRRKA